MKMNLLLILTTVGFSPNPYKHPCPISVTGQTNLISVQRSHGGAFSLYWDSNVFTLQIRAVDLEEKTNMI